MSNYSVETFIRVYDNKTGEFIQVHPDVDGLDLIEVTEFHNTEVAMGKICLGPPEQAMLVAEAILQLCEELSNA